MRLTIITPAYNRAALLGCLFDSLKSQTSKSFEWLIIDDGSTDDTQQVVKQMLEQDATFSIRYYAQQNGGKHRAVNFGVAKAKGDFCFIVDSDDYLDKSAVELILQWVDTLPPHYAGVAGLKAYENGSIVGGRGYGHGEYIDATNLERRRYGLLGDKAEVYRTAILRKYPFPEFEGEKFLSEAVVWNRIAKDGYRLRWYSKTIYYCEYLEGGLTSNIRQQHRRSPRGFALYIKEMAECGESLLKRLVLYGLYARDVYGYKNLSSAAADLQVPHWQVGIGVIIRRAIGR